MKSFQIIEQLQDVMMSGYKIPFSNKVIIDLEKALGLSDELLRVMPDEMKEAQKIIEDRKSILIDAQQEGEIIVKEAKDTIDKMINQDKITKLAKEKSEEILTFAKQTARDLRAGANMYADEVLEDAQTHLETLLETLKKSRDELNKAR